MTGFRILPPLPAEPPRPAERCKHATTEREVQETENKGGGPRVACHVETCRECRWSWIARKVRR